MYQWMQVAELQRAVHATRKVVPHIPLLDEDVARLQQVGYMAKHVPVKYT